MDGKILVHVKFIEDLRRWTAIRVLPESTVGEFKRMITVLLRIPVDQQILVYIDRRLEDDQTIASYGLQDGHAVYLFRRFVPPLSSASLSIAASAPAPVGGISTPVSGSVQSLGFGGGDSASLSPGLDGSSNITVPGILINVQYHGDTRFAMRVRPESTVYEIKSLINQLQNIPVNEQRLIYCGQFLQDHQTIGNYGLEDGFVIQLARRSVPADAVPAAELYADQLTWLRRMGFHDTGENIQALLATSGNVPAAAERLILIRFSEGSM